MCIKSLSKVSQFFESFSTWNLQKHQLHPHRHYWIWRGVNRHWKRQCPYLGCVMIWGSVSNVSPPTKIKCDWEKMESVGGMDIPCGPLVEPLRKPTCQFPKTGDVEWMRENQHDVCLQSCSHRTDMAPATCCQRKDPSVASLEKIPLYLYSVCPAQLQGQREQLGWIHPMKEGSINVIKGFFIIVRSWNKLCASPQRIHFKPVSIRATALGPRYSVMADEEVGRDFAVWVQ